MTDINESVNPAIIQIFESINSIDPSNSRFKAKVMKSSCNGISHLRKRMRLGVAGNIDLQSLVSVPRRDYSRQLGFDELMNSHHDSPAHRLGQ